MNAKEIKLNNLYNTMRDRLVSRFANDFNAVGAHSEDAVNAAFEYVAPYLLERKDDFTAKDLENMICDKVNNLLKDARSSFARAHGRRSVKTVAILDEEHGDGDEHHVSLIEKHSLTDYFERTANEGDENLVLLKAKAIDCIRMKYKKSVRDRIICDRSLWCSPDQDALAAEFNTSVSNVRRVKSEDKKFMLEHKHEIRRCYAVLKRQYEMAKC